MIKQFTCDCADKQFKRLDQVFVGFSEQSIAEILCAYRPNDKVTLRRVKLGVNYCPTCGKELKTFQK